MAVVVKDELMAAGSWSVDLDYTPAIHEALWDGDAKTARLLHSLHYDAVGNLVYVGVLRSVKGDERGLTIGGPGPLWHLGVAGGPGPTITDREYVSGTNKLSNPLFLLNPPDIYWRRPSEQSRWVIATGHAACGGGLESDDVLESDEKFPTDPAKSYRGEAFDLTGSARTRIRFEGRFDPPDIFPDFAGWGPSTRGDIVATTDPLGVVSGPVYRCHTVAVNRAPNGHFDDGVGLNGWVGGGPWFFEDADGTAWSPPGYAYTDTSILVAGDNHMDSSADGGVTPPAVPLVVAAGETWEISYFFRTHPATTTDGEAFGRALLSTGGTFSAFVETQHVASETEGWTFVTQRIDIPDGVDGLVPQSVTRGMTVGRWDVDNVTVLRVKGNLDSVTGPAVAVTPERTYRWTVPYRTAIADDIGVVGGRVQLQAVATRSGHPDILLAGSDLKQATDTPGLQQATWDIVPPSGYDGIALRLYCEDVPGAVYVGRGTLVDADRSSVVFDGLAGSVTATAPQGAEWVQLQLVVEQAEGASITGMSLARTGVTPATGDAIVAQLLTQPETGAPLSIVAGTVSCPEITPYDWRLVNLTNRAALEHYCAVVSVPAREYRVDPGLPPTLSVGTAAAIFADHSPDTVAPIVLLPHDRDVESLGNPDIDTTERATHIHVIGADRRTASGRDFTIEATAAVPGPVELDWFGRPVVRTKTVSAGTVDHFGYAQALASDLAEREANPPLVLTGKVSGRDTRPSYVVGDWLYAYHPEAGVEGDHETTIEGEPVKARRVRVLAMERVLGPSYRIEMRKSDGTTFTLPGVLWSDEDATVLTVGDRLPDWQADPQGRAEGVQYVEDRKSRPR